MSASLPGKQEQMLEKLRGRGDVWYLPADASERAILANLRKRGRVAWSSMPLDGKTKLVYRLKTPELDLGAFGAPVVPLRTDA